MSTKQPRRKARRRSLARMQPKGPKALSPNEKKVLTFHGLFPHLAHKEAFSILDISGFRLRDVAARSLLSKRLLTDQNALTPKGWETLVGQLGPEVVQLAVNSWANKIRDTRIERDQIASEFRPLLDYAPKLFREPDERPEKLDMPSAVKGACEGFLAKARLCIMVGAWSGSVAYCSTAAEQVLAEVFARKGTRKPFEEMPPLVELLGEVSKATPQIYGLTKKLVQLIANFRNDAVHPRDHSMRPGEHQTRAVYELTCRFLSEVTMDWFAERTTPSATGGVPPRPSEEKRDGATLTPLAAQRKSPEGEAVGRS